MTGLNAVILLPEEERQNPALLSRGLNHIARNGDRFDSIVSSWTQLKEMLSRQDVQVVVYVDPAHINPAWLPRFELAGAEAAQLTEQPSGSTRRRQRRPRAVG